MMSELGVEPIPYRAAAKRRGNELLARFDLEAAASRTVKTLRGQALGEPAPGRVPAKAQPVVQAIGASLPELD